MSEIQDLKNHISGMSSKMNHIVDMVRNSFTVNDKMNELLTLMHQIGLANKNKNDDIFGCILPDVVKRIASLENEIRQEKKELGAYDHIDFIVGKGKNKHKVHLVIKHNGITLYSKEKSLFVEL